MRGLAAVFGREVAERRMLPLVALGLGLVPLGAAFFPGLSRESPVEVRSGMAALLALGLTLALSVLLGGSVIARDLGERRLGFYFARPLGGWTIWGGKLAAAAALTFGAGFLVMLPTALLNARWPDPGSAFGLINTPDLWITLGLASILLLLASHVLAVVLRSRSPWLVLDFAGAVTGYVLLASAFRRLVFAGVSLPWGWFLAVVAGLALIALLIAGAAQVVDGRTDARRGHRALSLWLWGLLLAGALGVQAYAGWTLAGTPRDLAKVSYVVGSPGSWIAVQGRDERRNLGAAFLVDVASGRHQRIRSVWMGMDEGVAVRFSSDGGRVAWLEPPPGTAKGLPLQLRVLDLRRPGAEPVESPVTYDSLPSTLAVSPDGSLVASVLGGRLLVAEVATGNAVASAKLPGDFDFWEDAELVAPGVRLRGYRAERIGGSESAVRLTWELDLATGQLRPVGDFGRSEPVWSADGRRAVRFNPALRSLELLDGWSGRTLAWLPWGGPPPRSFAILADGRIALTVLAKESTEVWVFPPDLSSGQPRFRLPGDLSLAGQPGRDLLIAVAPGSSRTLLLDLTGGSSREIGQGLEPVYRPWPGSAGSRLFQDRDGRLVQLDPGTGALRPVLGTGDKS